MELRQLSVSEFRNLDLDRCDFAAGTNVILGANGQGKTNLLEAIAVLGNLRSFRQASPRKTVRNDGRRFRIEGLLTRSSGQKDILRLTQTVDVGPPVRRELKINGAPASLEQYLVQFPVFSLSARDSLLVTGPPDGRRALLDRLAFFLDQRHLADLRTYRLSLRHRTAAILSARSDLETTLWEDRLADAAAHVVIRRRRAVLAWRSLFFAYYRDLRPKGFPDVTLDYRSEADLQGTADDAVAENLRQRYHANRARDRQAGFTVDGPHRHDLLLRVGVRSARDVLSAGQIKTVVAALCLSTLVMVEEQRKELLPIVVDDVDAEIDDEVLARLVDVLGDQRQVFMSSAHEKNLIGVVSDARRLLMVEGSLQQWKRPSEVDDE